MKQKKEQTTTKSPALGTIFAVISEGDLNGDTTETATIFTPPVQVRKF